MVHDLDDLASIRSEVLSYLSREAERNPVKWFSEYEIQKSVMKKKLKGGTLGAVVQVLAQLRSAGEVEHDSGGWRLKAKKSV